MFQAPDLVDDLVQELNAWLLVSLHKIEHPEYFRAYLQRRITSLAMNHLREKYRRRSIIPFDEDTFLESEHPAPDSEMERKEDESRWEGKRQKLLSALPRIPASYREIIELHYFQEHPYPKIAGILGISEEQAKKRGQRALKALKIFF